MLNYDRSLCYNAYNLQWNKQDKRTNLRMKKNDYL